MNDDKTFLKAISALPNDRSLRHAYSDWLEERGDPRAELIRIEEEMRQIAVYSDRYWELKPCRNEIRAKVASTWLKKMRYGTDCLPIFGHGWPDGWKERWRLVREFLDRWRQLQLPDVGGHKIVVKQTELQLKRKLPPSVREWIAFAQDVHNKPQRMDVRGISQLEELPEYSAISLFLQGKSDYYWTVRHVDLVLFDPPVYFYHRIEEANVPAGFIAEYRNPIASSLSSFALEYSMIHTAGEGGGDVFDIDAADLDRLIRDLEISFPVHVRIDETDIFEMDNMNIRVSPMSLNIARVAVEWASPVTRQSIPHFVWEFDRDGNSHDLLERREES